MKKLFFIVVFLYAYTIQAQNNLGAIYSNPNSISAARYFPSMFDLGQRKIQVSPFNTYVWLGNTTYDYKTLNTIYNSGTVNDNDVNTLISKLKKTNMLGAGAEVQWLAVAFQLKVAKGKKDLTFGFSIEDKAGASLVYSDNLAKLAFRGNKQFAGQSVDLSPVSLNASYIRQYVASAAIPIFGTSDGPGLRAGVRVKIIDGMASLYTQQSAAILTTASDGTYLNAQYNYQINTSGFNNFSPVRYNGSGLGMDLGLTFKASKNFSLSTSLLDLGAVRYTSNTTTYEKQGNVMYQGLVIGNLFGDNQNNTDSVSGIVKPNTIKNKHFTMPLSTRFCMQAEYRTFAEDGKGREYSPNVFYLTYIQGLNNMPGASTIPFISAGYRHEFKHMLLGGFSASYGGYNKLALGTFISLNINRKINFGIFSDNLTAFILPSYGTGLSIGSNFTLSF